MGYILLATALMALSSFLISSRYQKYRNVLIDSQITGFEAARLILNHNGLANVRIEAVPSGTLSDFYDPKQRSVHLSPEVYNGRSIASVAVAAHEVGHAIQHQESYGFLALRNRLLPGAIIGSKLGWGVLFFGLLTEISSLFTLGIFLIALVALFQLVTLPVELDASRRAAVQLVELNIVHPDEVVDVKSMLNAAAFTYIAALITTLLQMLRFISIRNSRRD